MSHLFLLRFSGELSIKAKGTRRRFVQRLVRNLADGLAASGVRGEIERSWSRLFLRADSEAAGGIAARTFGVQSVSPALERPWRTVGDLLDAGEEVFAPRLAGKTFAVRVRRSGERDKIPFLSGDLERALGTRLLPRARGVDLEAPEVTAGLEVFPGRAYLFSDRLEGPGGIPLGVEGRALALISGGFDSAVAAWRMLRRGVRLDYLFFNLGGDAHREAVLRVLEILVERWSHGYRPQLHLVDLRPAVEEMKERTPARLWQVLLKRRMLEAADTVASESRAQALVTGEAVAQVSSQTLHNLAVISQATELPILRPLVGSHKEEIVEEARRIGTQDASSKVPELCALDAPKPATRAGLAQVRTAEETLDPTTLSALVETRAVLDLRALDLARTRAPGLEVEEIPEDAAVLDLRSRAAYGSWHHPRALHMDYPRALEDFRSLERGRAYVTYCEVGLKSVHLAEVMHAAGYRAGVFRGGLKRLMRQAEEDEPALAAALSPALLTE